VAGEDLQTGNKFILDTGIILRYLWGVKQAADLFEFLNSIGEIHTSVIVYLEILVGRKPNEEESIKLFFKRVTPILVNQDISEKAAILIRKYRSIFGRNNPRRFPDAIIAATAWQQKGAFITLNKNQFAKTKINEFVVKVIDQDTKDWISILKH